MKSKLICDGCNEDLKKVVEELESCVFIINDNIGGLSMMKHNNCKNNVVICEVCDEHHRQDLIDNAGWSDLEMLDSGCYSQDFFRNYEQLIEAIKKLS